MDSSGLHLTLGKAEYKFRTLQLKNAEEAEVIYSKLKTEMGEGKVLDKRWSNDELELLQWVVLNYSWQNKKPMETLVDFRLTSRSPLTGNTSPASSPGAKSPSASPNG